MSREHSTYSSESVASLAKLSIGTSESSLARDVADAKIKLKERRDFAAEFFKTRPEHATTKEGSSGEKVQLKANCFPIDELANLEFNQYRVDFEPDLELINVRKALVGKHISSYGGYLYDGANIIFITSRLPQDEMSFDCETREGKKYKLILKNTKQIIDRADPRVLLVLNIMLRRAMEGLNLKLIQRNLFDPENAVDIQEYKLKLWPGYQTSIRQYESSILVNCDMRFKVMRQQTIYDILRACISEDKQKGRDNFKAQILGSIVLASYGMKRTYRVDDVDFNMTPKTTFNWKGRDISYMDYFKEQYEIVIKDPNQPMLLSTPKERTVRGSNNKGMEGPVCLVPELFFATGLTDSMKNNFQLMRALAEHTRMDPTRRVERLLSFNRRLQSTEASMKQFDQFHTKLKPNLVEFSGRELAQEDIIFGEGKTFKSEARNVDWTNAMKTNYMHTNVDLKRWVMISPRRAMADSQKFLQLLREVANGMRYSMGDPKIFEINDDRVGTYANELAKVIQMDPKLILIVLPNNAADRYAAIKKITCINNAIPTQVIVQKTMMPKKGNMGAVKSVATKVLIQMNCKLGGAAWMIKMPIGGCMIVGFDVTHDSGNKNKSFGAFVAALDIKSKPKFFSSVSAHRNNEECSNNIAVHMRKALMTYRDEYGTLPERIIFYRDGVGDGDIEFVNRVEVKALTDLYQEVYGQSPKPKFAFVIVNKRINLRIFKSIGNRVDNPLSGTVADSTVTLPERYDFYLISQSVRQGTVAPTSYNIVYDTFGLTPDRLQLFTYKMCHLYYNWSGTTRVPAVVQYCQKLAMLVGQHLHAAPEPKLENQLYFL